MNRLTPEIFLEAMKYLSDPQDNLVKDVEIILQRIAQGDHISDYSFAVSPISKAYEGHLKDFFLKLRIIDNNNYQSDRFRVGKTLNPSLRYKRFSIYQKLADYDEKGEELAEMLWNAWKYGRNEIFHYFPNSVKVISRQEAEDRIYMVLNAIIASGKFCKLHCNDADLV